jgi:hypothetical protein
MHNRRRETALARKAKKTGGHAMAAKLSADELQWLKALDTEAPQKPDLPAPISDRLVEEGLAIKLVEGGLQLTALGREYLTEASDPVATAVRERGT